MYIMRAGADQASSLRSVFVIFAFECYGPTGTKYSGIRFRRVLLDTIVDIG